MWPARVGLVGIGLVGGQALLTDIRLCCNGGDATTHLSPDPHGGEAFQHGTVGDPHDTAFDN